MEQLSWLQQSLQKPRLSAVARVLAEAFPRPGVPAIDMGGDRGQRGTYQNRANMPSEYAEYPGLAYRVRAMENGGNYASYGWQRAHTDHAGVVGGQLTVMNDGFMSGLGTNRSNTIVSTLSATMTERHSVETTVARYEAHSLWTPTLNGFASVEFAAPPLLVSVGGVPLAINNDGTLLQTTTPAVIEPIARGFVSLQALTSTETRRVD